MTTAFIYCRVSTDEQARKGYGLEVQEEQCRAYAAAHGLDVASVFADDYTGTTLERPAMTLMRQALAQGLGSAVIAHRANRFSRDDVDYLVFLKNMWAAGVQVHLADKGELKQQSGVGKFLTYLDGWQGNEENDQRTKATSNGRQAKARAGKWVGIGFAPFGYQRQGERGAARLVIDPTEAAVVKQIFEWYTVGPEGQAPLSLQGIALALEAQGAPTPNHRRNAAEHWIPATLHGILTNEIYTGRAYYGKSKRVDPGEWERARSKRKPSKRRRVEPPKKPRIEQPRDQWTSVDLPELAIVDPVTFALAQERAARNKQLAARNRKFDYLLSGFFRCKACDGAMAGSVSRPNGYETRYYRCGNHWHKTGAAPCPNSKRTIVTHLVENIAWEWFKRLLEDDEILRTGLAEYAQTRESELGPKRDRLGKVGELSAEADRKIKRLATAFGNEQDEIVADALRGEMKATSRIRESLVIEADKLRAEIEHRAITEAQAQSILAQAAAIRDKLRNPTTAQKRALFDVLDFKAVFRADDTGRWCDVSCGLTGEEIIVLPLSSGSFQR